MRWGRVEATSSFFLLLAWLNYLDRQAIVPMAMAACALHELGHYLVIRAVGGNIKLIRLTAIGAEMVVDRPLGYWQEGVSALAGPAVNLALALFFCVWDWGLTFSGLNLVLACFNLLPVGRMDGGRVLGCALALLAGPDLAAQVGACLDWVCSAVLLVLGFLLAKAGGNITLLLVSIWVAGLCFQTTRFDRRRNRTCQRGRKQVQ